jgi:hypothetical protein
MTLRSASVNFNRANAAFSLFDCLVKPLSNFLIAIAGYRPS